MNNNHSHNYLSICIPNPDIKKTKNFFIVKWQFEILKWENVFHSRQFKVKMAGSRINIVILQNNFSLRLIMARVRSIVIELQLSFNLILSSFINLIYLKFGLSEKHTNLKKSSSWFWQNHEEDFFIFYVLLRKSELWLLEANSKYFSEWLFSKVAFWKKKLSLPLLIK